MTDTQLWDGLVMVTPAIWIIICNCLSVCLSFSLSVSLSVSLSSLMFLSLQDLTLTATQLWAGLVMETLPMWIIIAFWVSVCLSVCLSFIPNGFIFPRHHTYMSLCLSVCICYCPS
jgi:hypothetical protein